MIEDVIVTKKRQITDDRGKVKHMMRNDDSLFKDFGEIYFSEVFPKKIKAWHLHKKMTLNYVAISGNIKLVLFDDREESKSFGKIQEIVLTNKNYCLVTVPPLIWNGFTSIDNKSGIIANCSDIPHDPEEIIRKPFDDKYFPYSW